VCDPTTGAVLCATAAGPGEINAVAFDPRGTLLAAAGRDVRLWDPGRGDPVLTLAEPSLPVRALAFSADDRLLATGGDDRTARRFDLEDLRRRLDAMGLGW
ncbi:MAG TPA: hypothetical protein VF590_22215, partial [Isosphaeraceae bacterium]